MLVRRRHQIASYPILRLKRTTERLPAVCIVFSCSIPCDFCPPARRVPPQTELSGLFCPIVHLNSQLAALRVQLGLFRFEIFHATHSTRDDCRRVDGPVRRLLCIRQSMPLIPVGNARAPLVERRPRPVSPYKPPPRSILAELGLSAPRERRAPARRLHKIPKFRTRQPPSARPEATSY